MTIGNYRYFALVTIISCFSCKSTKQTTATNNTDPVIEVIGDKPVYASEFNYVYKKNNANSDNAYSDKSIKEYLDLYTNFRLKVREAETLGLDTAQSFKKELDGYKKQLAQPYLTEKSVTEKLSKEAYERMKEEINASHILLTVGPDADPKDTLEAFNKINELRARVLKGESFDKLAEEFSQDPSAKVNKGNLGYFSSLQMVYPFENAAYSTAKGQVSAPVRTKFGYHILQVKDRRPSQGQVRVAHIMIRTTQGMAAADSIAAKNKIDEIYSRLQKGEEWKTLTDQFSEDGNSKSKGGELPFFSTGKMIPSFEEAAFALANPGDYSKPVQTPYGWHIIKMLERKPLEPYTELESTIKTKVSKDTRSELNKTVLLERLKKENALVEYNDVLNNALTYADSSLIKATWNKKADNTRNGTLFTIGQRKYSVNDFFTYLNDAVKKSRISRNGSPQQYMKNLYKAYTEEQLIGYEEANLENKYNDYKMLVKEYRDGILLFQLMDEKVWSKAIQDTSGLKDYFSSHKEKYNWDKRAFAAIYSVPNETTLQKVKEELKKGTYPVKNIQLENSYFGAGKTELDEQNKTIAETAGAKLKRDRNYILQITGYADIKEKSPKGITSLGLARAKAAKAFLISKGIDSTLISIADGGKLKAKSAEGKDSERKVTYTILSKSSKSLEAVFNENAPLTLQVTEGAFQKGDNAILDSAEWKSGNQTISKNGRIYYLVIQKIEEPRPKTFEEARGVIISDYQNFLEQQWIKSLKEKYPVTVKQEEVQKLIKQ